jgi:hypothetical protein
MRLPVIASIVFLASAASAQNEPPPPPPPMPAAPQPAPPPPAEPTRNVSVTFSPIHLAAPIVELAAELRVTDKISIAAIGGYGSIKVTDPYLKDHRFSAFEVGAHLNYYAIGTFDHGMQLGIEALYAKVMTDGSDVKLSGSADGLAIGPYVGYKLITRIGFTFEANGGVEYVTARANATDGTNKASGSSATFIPLINLNVGWSF